jgi:hypothetical protein
MKAKKTLVLVVITLTLLAVALILPAAAYGKCPTNKHVSWVSVCTSYRFPDMRGSTVANVLQLADESLRGQVVVGVFREFWPLGEDPEDLTRFDYVVKTDSFTALDFWDAPLGPHLAHADFFFATTDNWPADLGEAPEWWPDYKGAAVADFVAYVPVSQYPELLPWPKFFGDIPSIPYRFMFIDSGKRGRADVMLNWLISDVGWQPTVWTVPIQTGYIQVHVGK